jgi:hypothetical protein
MRLEAASDEGLFPGLQDASRVSRRRSRLAGESSHDLREQAHSLANGFPHSALKLRHMPLRSMGQQMGQHRRQ